MPAFDGFEKDGGRLDWALLQAGTVAAYHDLSILDQDLTWLRSHGYTAFDIEAGLWTDAGALHQALQAALGFPDYYGRNLAALADALADLPVLGAGVVVVFRSFDQFFKRAPGVAVALLDTFAVAAWQRLLTGDRLLVMVQSSDPVLEWPSVGAQAISWNPREWMAARRSAPGS